MFLTFFQWICTVYGTQATRFMKEKAHINDRLTQLKNRRIFLTRCRQLDIIPKCIRTNWRHLEIKHMETKMTRWKNKIENELLNILIAETNTEIDFLYKRLKYLDNKLENMIPQHIMAKFNESQRTKNEQKFIATRDRQGKKIEHLKKEKFDKFKNMVKPEWIKNISDTDIPEYANFVLSLGPNFGLPYEYKRLPIIKVLSAVENALFNNPVADEIRAKTINITRNFLNCYKRAKNSDKFLLLMVNQTKKFLKDNQQIVVIKSDKCKKTVVMNKSDYERSMDKMLNDKDTYKKTKINPTTRIEKAANNMIKYWRMTNRINDEQERYLQTHNSVPPAIYGLGKLHKWKEGEMLPLRPVVATIQSPTYKISEVISKVLSKIIHASPYRIKDSWQFNRIIKVMKIPKGYKMFSLDATSLFTNIPKELCVRAIEKRWLSISEHTSLSKEQFIDAVKLIIDESYFKYGDAFYLQSRGVAMGNAISGFLADLVMEDLEVYILNNIPFVVPFYRRFVDDILAFVPEDKIDQLVAAFNNYHPMLKFTFEEENDKSINFLDMTLTRDDFGNITTKWYRKEIASGRYLHFQGHNPVTHKRNVASAITDRAIAFTNPNDRPQSIETVKTLLHDNGYPKEFVNEIVKTRVNKFYNGNKSVQATKKIRYIAAPYVPGLAERINKTLREYDMALGCKAENNVGNAVFSKTKYPIPKKMKSKVIYRIDCLDCPAKYPGQTKQKIVNRTAKHRSDIKTGKLTETTGLTIHAVKEKHSFDFDNIKILDHIPNYHQRCIAEKMHICNTKNTVNLLSDTKGLHESYVNLFSEKRK